MNDRGRPLRPDIRPPGEREEEIRRDALLALQPETAGVLLDKALPPRKPGAVRLVGWAKELPQLRVAQLLSGVRHADHRFVLLNECPDTDATVPRRVPRGVVQEGREDALQDHLVGAHSCNRLVDIDYQPLPPRRRGRVHRNRRRLDRVLKVQNRWLYLPGGTAAPPGRHLP